MRFGLNMVIITTAAKTLRISYHPPFDPSGNAVEGVDDLAAEEERLFGDLFPSRHPKHGVRFVRHGLRGGSHAVLDVFRGYPSRQGCC